MPRRSPARPRRRCTCGWSAHPGGRSKVRSVLDAQPGVGHLVVHAGVAVYPAGDLVEADVVGAIDAAAAVLVLTRRGSRRRGADRALSEG